MMARSSTRLDAGDAVDAPVVGVVGEVRAGSRQPIRLQPRQAVRVDTGAPLPTLADAVLPLDYTDQGTARIKVLKTVRSGDYVRRTGDDVQPGDVAVRAGTIIGAAQVGLLAAVGRDKVLVHPRPRLSVISVGGELVDVERTPGPGQVYDVNSYALAAAARDAANRGSNNPFGLDANYWLANAPRLQHPTDARSARDLAEGQAELGATLAAGEARLKEAQSGVTAIAAQSWARSLRFGVLPPTVVRRTRTGREHNRFDSALV